MHTRTYAYTHQGSLLDIAANNLDYDIVLSVLNL